jgi:uncharacterized protein with HEPN domain
MFHSDKELLQHIFDEIKFLENETDKLTESKFLKDEKSQRAFARSIEIIGEAVKNISEETIANHPSIEWRKISGMRDKLIHGYFSVNYRLVWDVAMNLIPKLKIQLEYVFDKIK